MEGSGEGTYQERTGGQEGSIDFLASYLVLVIIYYIYYIIIMMNVTCILGIERKQQLENTLQCLS